MAFDVLSGRINDAPAWVRTADPQWFPRLLQELRRLWKRYRINNRKFVWRIAPQLTGITHYRAACASNYARRKQTNSRKSLLQTLNKAKESFQ